MQVGDLVKYTVLKYIGIIIKVDIYKLTPYQILWCFGEDVGYYKEKSWVYSDDIELISERT